MADDPQLSRRRAELELQKLELEVARETARATLADLERRKIAADAAEAERAERRDARAADLHAQAMRKSQLEIAELEKRAAGREPNWKWNRGQQAAIIVGVLVSATSLLLTYLTFLRSINQAREARFQVAAQHLQEGWPSGAIELRDFGEDGLAVLVKSVDPTHRTVQKSWPVVTLAALEEIERQQDSLSPEQQETLRKARDESDSAIRTRLAELPRIADETAKNAKHEELQSFVCVQRALQNISGEPANWKATEGDIIAELGTSECD